LTIALPEAIYREAHLDIVTAIAEIAARGDDPDLALVAAHLKQHRKLTACGGTAYLALCLEQPSSWKAGAKYARIIAAHHLRRCLSEAANQIARLAKDNGKPTADLMAEAAAALSAIPVAQTRLPTRNGEELMRELDSVEWLWPGWLPRGFVTCIVGDPGIKKSAIALHMAVQLGCAGKWPDGSQMTEQGGTLWLDAENMQRANVDRLRAWKAEGSAIHWLGEDGLAPVELSRRGFFEQCGRTALALGCKLVVLDSLSSAHEDDPDSNKEMGRMLREITKTAQLANLAVLLIHHPRKKRESESPEITLERFRGASAVGAGVRVAWGAWQPDKSNLAVRVAQVKNNFWLQPEAFGVLWEAEGLRFVEAPDEPDKPETAVDRAEGFLRNLLQNGPVAWVDVDRAAKEANISMTGSIGRAFERIGIISFTPQGKRGKFWALPAPKANP